jgi:hypothetical protein
VECEEDVIDEVRLPCAYNVIELGPQRVRRRRTCEKAVLEKLRVVDGHGAAADVGVIKDGCGGGRSETKEMIGRGCNDRAG